MFKGRPTQTPDEWPDLLLLFKGGGLRKVKKSKINNKKKGKKRNKNYIKKFEKKISGNIQMYSI